MDSTNTVTIAGRLVGEPRTTSIQGRGPCTSGRLVFANGSSLPFCSFNEISDFMACTVNGTPVLCVGSIVGWGSPQVPTLKIFSVAPLEEVTEGQRFVGQDQKDNRMYPLAPLSLAVQKAPVQRGVPVVGGKNL